MRNISGAEFFPVFLHKGFVTPDRLCRLGTIDDLVGFPCLFGIQPAFQIFLYGSAVIHHSPSLAESIAQADNPAPVRRFFDGILVVAEGKRYGRVTFVTKAVTVEHPGKTFFRRRAKLFCLFDHISHLLLNRYFCPGHFHQSHAILQQKEHEKTGKDRSQYFKQRGSS
jgi:hypothetical protein